MAFVKNTMITFFTMVSITLLTMIMSVVIARSLTPAGQGLYALILLIPKILILFSELGTSLSVVFFGGSKNTGGKT
jgi:Polysaccharide biosynthesis protein.